MLPACSQGHSDGPLTSAWPERPLLTVAVSIQPLPTPGSSLQFRKCPHCSLLPPEHIGGDGEKDGEADGGGERDGERERDGFGERERDGDGERGKDGDGDEDRERERETCLFAHLSCMSEVYMLFPHLPDHQLCFTSN